MKWNLWHAIGLLAGLGILRIHAEIRPPPTPNTQQKEVLKNTVKALLDFKDAPKEGHVTQGKSRNAASKYMRKLYKQYKQADEGFTARKGNIARSITPTIGYENGVESLQFDLSVIKPTEVVLRSEIHFNLRANRHYLKKRRYRHLHAYAVTSTSAANQSALPQLELNPDWLSYNAAAVVSERRGRHLAVVFKRLKKGGHFKALDNAKVVRRHTPFLMVFSNDPALINKENVMSAVPSHSFAASTEKYASDEILIDDLQSPSSLSSNTDNLQSAESNLRHTDYRQSTASEELTDDLQSNRVKRSGDYYKYQLASETVGKGRLSATYHRGDEDKLTLHVRAFQSGGPEVLNTRSEMRKNRKLRNKLRRKNNRKGNKLPFPPGSNLPPFGTVDNSWFRPKQNSSNGSEIPNSKGNGEPDVFLLGNEPPAHGNLCGRKNFVVRFQDIGWGDLIIAPAKFESHFCAGVCPFPLNAEVNPSNHALIQSIVHAIGLNPYVPGVCCAPDKMDSQTLLYFDEKGNVVLKNYPKMIVKSCGCI